MDQTCSRSACENNIAARLPESKCPLALVEHEGNDEVLNIAETTTVRAALDSGSVAHVTPPDTIPGTVQVEPNTTGKHFSGAGGDTIERFGRATTNMQGKWGTVPCNWEVAGVTRTLNSVSQICGPEKGSPEYDVLFNNEKAVVVPPGIVNEVLKKVKPVAQYDREGGLYVAGLTLSGFTPQGRKA